MLFLKISENLKIVENKNKENKTNKNGSIKQQIKEKGFFMGRPISLSRLVHVKGR